MKNTNKIAEKNSGNSYCVNESPEDRVFQIKFCKLIN